MVECRAVNGVAGGSLVLLTLGRHRYLVELQRFLFQRNAQPRNVFGDVYGELAGGIAQTLNGQCGFAHRHVLDAEHAVGIGDGPIAVFLHQDGGKLNGLMAVIVGDAAGYRHVLCLHGYRAADNGQAKEEYPFVHVYVLFDCKFTIFLPIRQYLLMGNDVNYS